MDHHDAADVREQQMEDLPSAEMGYGKFSQPIISDGLTLIELRLIVVAISKRTLRRPRQHIGNGHTAPNLFQISLTRILEQKTYYQTKNRKVSKKSQLTTRITTLYIPIDHNQRLS